MTPGRYLAAWLENKAGTVVEPADPLPPAVWLRELGLAVQVTAAWMEFRRDIDIPDLREAFAQGWFLRNEGRRFRSTTAPSVTSHPKAD